MKSKFRVNNRGNILLITFIGVFGAISPYIHIFFHESEVQGIFGFKSMESFLFCVGFPVLSICAGLLLFLASKYVTTELTNVFKVFSILFLFTGSFFLSWSLMPSVDDYDPRLYYLALISISIGGTCIFYYLNTALITLNEKITYLIDLVARIRSDHFFTLADKAKAHGLDQEELQNDIEDFDDQVFTTLKQITK